MTREALFQATYADDIRLINAKSTLLTVVVLFSFSGGLVC